jgi:hypothetical protein
MTSLDEYVDLALRLIETESSSPGHAVTAAFLGVLLRRARPDITWEAFHLRTLKDLLIEMKRRGLIEFGENNSGALAVWPAQRVLRLDPPPRPKTFNPLRKQFWVAFVVDQPKGRRFVHRPTGLIKMGLTESPSPVDEWIEITPVSDTLQRQWLSEFLSTRSLSKDANGIDDPVFAAVLQSDDWFRELPHALADRDPQLVREWNRLRSSRVSEAVRTWCAKNAMDSSLAFESSDHTYSAAAQLKSDAPRPEGVLETADAASSKTESTRSRILAALQQLPTEYLMEIPIPAKYLLHAEAHPGRD